MDSKSWLLKLKSLNSFDHEAIKMDISNFSRKCKNEQKQALIYYACFPKSLDIIFSII